MRLPLFLVASATIIGLSLKPISSSPGSTSYKVNDEFTKTAGQFASRILRMNHRRKFLLPRGTIITLTPQITFPVFKQKMTNGGLQSDFQGSMVFYVRCDKLGMTPPEPIQDIPPFYPFGSHMAQQNRVDEPAGDKGEGHEGYHQRPHRPMDDIYLPPFPNHYVRESAEDSKRSNNKVPVQQASGSAPLPSAYFDSSPYQFKKPQEQDPPRRKRSVMSLPPPDSIHGGERAIILPSIEGHLSSFGFDSGRSCMLRAICEIHELPLSKMGYGLIGEMITLFFSVSESPYAESHMPEYLRAEKTGKSGDCSSYYKDCKKSIFKWEPKNPAEDILKNFIPS